MQKARATGIIDNSLCHNNLAKKMERIHLKRFQTLFANSEKELDHRI